MIEQNCGIILTDLSDECRRMNIALDDTTITQQDTGDML